MLLITAHTDISAATAMTIEDVFSTLQHLQLIAVEEPPPPPPLKVLPGQSIKYPKGRKSVAARRTLQRTQTPDTPSRASPDSPGGDGDGDAAKPKPFIPPAAYTVRCTPEEAAAWLARWDAKGHVRLRPERLRWTPFIVPGVPKTDGPDALPVAAAGELATPAQLAAGVVVAGASAGLGLAPAPPSPAALSAATADSTVQPDADGVVGSLEPHGEAPGTPRRLTRSSATPSRPTPRRTASRASAASSRRSARRVDSSSPDIMRPRDGVLPMLPRAADADAVAALMALGGVRHSDEMTVVAEPPSAKSTPGRAFELGDEDAEGESVDDDMDLL
jgi:hypothetical protein